METAEELRIRGEERRRIVGMILEALSQALNRGDHTVVEALDALATKVERSGP